MSDPKTITWTDKRTDETLTCVVLSEAEHVTQAHLDLAEQTWEDWFSQEPRIDWEDFLDRMADPKGFNDKGVPAFDFEEYDNAAIRKIQRHVRQYAKEG